MRCHNFFFERISNREKSIHIIDFMGKKAEWESWSEIFISHGKHKGYKKLLVSSRSMLGMDKIPTQDKYENALIGNIDLDKKILKLSELNKLAYEDLILSINTSSSVGKVEFGLVRKQRVQIFCKGTTRLFGKESFTSTSDKLLVLNGSTLYVP